jgi:hypothetical protein
MATVANVPTLIAIAALYLVSAVAYARLPPWTDNRAFIAFLLPTAAAVIYVLMRRLYARDPVRTGNGAFALTYTGTVERGTSVVVFPDDPSRWHDDSLLIAAQWAYPSGRYELRTLPAGHYLAAAWLSTEPGGAPPTRELLEELRPGATPVTLREGETVSLDLPAPRP